MMKQCHTCHRYTDLCCGRIIYDLFYCGQCLEEARVTTYVGDKQNDKEKDW